MSGPSRHRILARQLRRMGLNDEEAPSLEEWRTLLDRVDEVYQAADEDRYTLERASEISSRETALLHDKLRYDAERMAAVLNALPQGIVHMDASMHVCERNPSSEMFFGCLPPDEPIAKYVRLTDAHDQEYALEALLEQGHREPAGQIRTGCFEGPVSWQVVPIANDEVLLVIADLSALRAQEEALRAAELQAELSRHTEEARGRFLANVSHELRTPLTAILGYSELLAEEPRNPTEALDLQRIIDSAGHLLALINDLLDISKIDAGQMQANLALTALSPLLHRAADAVRPQIETHRNTLSITGPEVALLTDGIRLQQCVINLLSNASKYTHGGHIDLEVYVIENGVEIRVRDNGAGIPENRLNEIFKPFEQARQSDETKGTGLGLAVTQRYVGLMGGRIEVESELDQGSTFTMFFPKTPNGR